MTRTSQEKRGAGAPADGRREPRELAKLLVASGVEATPLPRGVRVSSIEYDSRAVTEGALFVAVRGFTNDGHEYVTQAAGRGAAAALVEAASGSAGIPELVVADTRNALGRVAHEFFGRPSERLVTHGITGTNGKTTTSYLVDAILRETGMTTGVVGTLGYRLGERVERGDRTSPESLDLARLMASMVEVGVQAVTLEVSSHALALGRAVGTKFDTATFTNLSRDHLDFHGSLEEYSDSKRLMFERLEGDAWKPGAAAIVNQDDTLGREILDGLRSSDRVRTIGYGLSEGDVHASDVESGPSGTRARFHTPDGSFDARLRLISAFNVMNALAATAVAVSQGIPLDAVGAGLASVERVAGRLDLVDAGQRFTVVIDYAHTPDALEKVLAALGELDGGRIITVFGCGGDRDRGKRPIMGAIAARGSDVVIVTSDNPRSEAPSAIISDILGGSGEGPAAAGMEVVEDRRDAIYRAVSLADPGDIVLIAGKGHEDYQIVGDERLHFDDREEARAAIEKLRTGR
jgi:UDP-N-acetylmuramoyl-L-alanyl-D-glutamate--2,6-diaminopimelate ligase